MFPDDLSRMMAEAMVGDADVSARRLEDGRTAWAERSPVPEMLFRVATAEAGRAPTYPILAFRGLPTRPADYPEDLPFIRDQPVVTGVEAGELLLAWMSPDDRNELVANLLAECTRHGWKLVSRKSHWTGTDHYELHRDARRRLIIDASFPALVELLETDLASDVARD